LPQDLSAAASTIQNKSKPKQIYSRRRRIPCRRLSKSTPAYKPAAVAVSLPPPLLQIASSDAIQQKP
jgi:hypothetical protein